MNLKYHAQFITNEFGRHIMVYFNHLYLINFM